MFDALENDESFSVSALAEFAGLERESAFPCRGCRGKPAEGPTSLPWRELRGELVLGHLVRFFSVVANLG